ncbi:hypothetical protein [Alloactinosynnema sp. L-07]|uniref:hypothetical protein n=1 Tax=Alloactinosynnema sp. L-07 TaxID=1653480 RepID=UPI0012FBEEC7|nr:hypothetical protein [Alloactinosynnema sp. L-07]
MIRSTSTLGDEGQLRSVEEVCPVELRDELPQDTAGSRRRRQTGVKRITGSARSIFQQRFCERTVSRPG